MTSNLLRRTEPLTVTTLLDPDERLRLAAVGSHRFTLIHRERMEDVTDDIKLHRAVLAVLSVTSCAGQKVGLLARVVRENPQIPAVAILSRLEPTTAHTVLTLGQHGVRTIVDVRMPQGWAQLRSLLMAYEGAEFQRYLVATLLRDITPVSADCIRFFHALFAHAWRTSSVRRLCRDLGVLPSTIMSRFFRAHLPAPKQYLTLARLVCASHLFDNSGMSISAVAHRLNYSSPQSFGRHVRTVIGLTASDFRAKFPGHAMLELFRARLVTPYAEQFVNFHPLREDDLLRRREEGSTSSRQQRGGATA